MCICNCISWCNCSSVLVAVVVCMLIGCNLKLQHLCACCCGFAAVWKRCCIVCSRTDFSNAHVMPVVDTCIKHISMQSQFDWTCHPSCIACNLTGHAVMRTQVSDRCGGRQMSAPECPPYTVTSIKPAGPDALHEGSACRRLPHGSRGWSSGEVAGLGWAKPGHLQTQGSHFAAVDLLVVWFNSGWANGPTCSACWSVGSNIVFVVWLLLFGWGMGPDVCL